MKKEKHEPRKVSVTVTILLCAFCLAVGGLLAMYGIKHALGPQGQAVLEADQIIRRSFVGDYDEQDHQDQVLTTMVNALGDRWSFYLDPEDYLEVQETRKNAYVGIGVTIHPDLAEGLTILAVTPGSPAEEQGLVPGEIIVAVDGIDITQATRQEGMDRIKGEVGEAVSLKVIGVDGTARTVEIQRREIQGITARWSMLEGNIGYISIKNFYSGTAELVRQGIQELTEQKAEGLILDVRNNPGGYVVELTDILDALLPEGNVFISRSYDGKETIYTSDAQCVDLPMAVLVNENTYSAAEFLAAQLNETNGAAIIGTQTSGKGYSQRLFPLADGSALSLSTARYFTAGGVSLIGTGLTPEPELGLSQEDELRLMSGSLPPEEDPPLQAAMAAVTAKK